MTRLRFMWLTTLAALYTATAFAQPALERLERQLQNPQAQPPARESGYLGLITRNDTAGGFIRVVQVVPDSPAALAGLRSDDLILSADGRLTREMNDLAAALQGRAPGERISLAVMRGQEERTIPVTLGRRPATTDGPMLISPQAGAAAPSTPPAVTTTQRPPAPPVAEATGSNRPGEGRGETARIDLLERRMAELERRLAEIERLLSRGP